MFLIIAEKPSLARNIAAGIGSFRKKTGYMEGEDYLITWAFGHLFSLCDIEAYTGQPIGTRWSMDFLPCFPDPFRFELHRKSPKDTVPDEGIQRQFEIISQLCNRPDVTEIIHAGDADREGEIIVRLCISHALKSPKPIKRLWLPDQTPQTVTKALGTMEPDASYDRLADEGLARTFIDWLYGVNLTRLASLKTGTLLRVGRVIIPIVKAIYDRDLSIRNFVPGHYYALLSKEETNHEIIELLSKQKLDLSDKAKAEAICARYNQQPAIVSSVKQKKEKLSPGKLYSLSKLQNVLGKKYKMSMQTSLALVQKLYEAGYVTYPRTDSEYLATAEKDRVKNILGTISHMGYPVAFKDEKSIFDDSKIESHSALTPTYKIPTKNALSEEENKVYSTIFRRFVAVFCSRPCVISKTEITIDVGQEESFLLKGTTILEEGWTKYDDRNVKDKVLPALREGDTVVTNFVPMEKETTAPKHYTIETLNNYLKNPFKEEKAAAKDNENEDDTEDYRAMFEGLELGTEATRTGIIDHARQSRYIALTKDVYTILPDGEFLIESLSRMNISMDKYKTSELGQALKKVYHGQSTVSETVSLAQSRIRQIFNNEKESGEGIFGEAVGSCPRCGRNVLRRKNFYGCEAHRETGCDFTLPMILCGVTLSRPVLTQLLALQTTDVISGFRSKAGKEFSAALRLGDEGRIDFVFPEKKKPFSRPLCPKCRQPILKGKTAWGCRGWKNGCSFRFPFEDVDGHWEESQLFALLSGETVLHGSSKYRMNQGELEKENEKKPGDKAAGT